MKPQKPTPGSASVYNHILQYTTQKRESQYPYTTFTPSHCAPMEPSRNIPTPPQSKQSWPLPEYAGIRCIPLSPDPALFPSPPLLGVSRVTAVQIHPTISRSVRAGSTRQTVPRSRPPRCGFTQQPKRDRSATWWPGDIHNRPSVQRCRRVQQVLCNI